MPFKAQHMALNSAVTLDGAEIIGPAVPHARRYVSAPNVSFAAVRQRRFDVLGDLVEEHLDTKALTALIEHGAPPGLPVLRLTLT